MSTPAGSEVEGLLDGVVQLRFGDDEGTLHDLSAAEMAQVLQGMVEFTSQMAKAGLFGDVMPPQVRVRPPKPGSVVIETVLQFTQTDTWTAAGEILAFGIGLVHAVNVATRKLRRTQVTSVTAFGDNDVIIQWQDGTVDQVPGTVWEELKDEKKKTKKALGKIMAPLGDDVTRLEIRGAGTEEDSDSVLASDPGAVLDRDDYLVAVAVAEDPDDQERTFEIEAALTSVDFREGKGWRIEVRQDGTRTERSVTVADRDFLRSVDEGRPVHKDDILRVRVHEVAKVRNGRNSTDWTIVEVLSQRRAGGDDASLEDLPTIEVRVETVEADLRSGSPREIER